MRSSSLNHEATMTRSSPIASIPTTIRQAPSFGFMRIIEAKGSEPLRGDNLAPVGGVLEQQVHQILLKPRLGERDLPMRCEGRTGEWLLFVRAQRFDLNHPAMDRAVRPLDGLPRRISSRRLYNRKGHLIRFGEVLFNGYDDADGA